MAYVRQLALESAREVLRLEGYAALSVRKVARAASISPSLIDYHFGSKDDLVVEVGRTEASRMFAPHERVWRSDEPLAVKWEQMCDALDADLKGGGTRVWAELMIAGISNANLARQISSTLGDLVGMIERALTIHVEHGMALPLDPRAFAATTVNMMLGASQATLLGAEADRTPARHALRAWADLLEAAETNPGT